MQKAWIETAWQHYKTGDLVSAQQMCAAELSRNSQDPNALRLMGLIAYQTDHPDEAIYFYERALRQAPRMGPWYYDLAKAYKTSGYIEEAITAVSRALQFAPDNAEYHGFLGGVYTDLNQIDNAIKSHQRARELNPKSTAAAYGLVFLAINDQYTLTDEEASSIRALADDESLTGRQRSVVRFACGELSHKEKNYDDAFNYFQSANQLKLESFKEYEKFNGEQHVEAIDRIVEFFNKEFFEHRKDFGSRSEVPVFIVGMPRSGTTLVEQIVSSHPQVHGAGELLHIGIIANDVLKDKETGKEFPEILDDIEQEKLTQLAEQYLFRVMQKAGDVVRVTDKMPTNFQLLGLIYTLFPNARVLHVRRDAMDSCWSGFRRNIKAKYTNSFEDIGEVYKQYTRLMKHWHAVSPIKILDVTYEELVVNYEETCRRMIEFLDLEWDDSCLNHVGSRESIGTASKLQVRQPVYTSAVGGWKCYEKHLQSLKEILDVAATAQ
ncbi:MAG: sulfotransferase [Gammaproteobacteria bacterium]|nr:sulfotransferase [Gammaproteobacteria bacterium]